ncbi:ABC transporter permease [Pseudoflavonifractor sp. MSJ-30]|uniref:ABC transporter permease n=1 Tax=Pseudoflavonifractor sp. MSJ-30 TaxID=2841525 RepID=UPI001C0FA78D|nr:ABC transporter permease [Pseudoflavonifractor sp. MSJ-30]MBU5452464.1 ABC transporter permease [Pseudoflavonifractor sp. MSJ-30]
MRSILKMTSRTIRSFFGRYLALLLIVALSVSFFAGLKVTKDAMYATAQDYLEAQNFCDFRLLSTLGFTDDDVDALRREGYVGKAEGVRSTDVLIPYEDGNKAFKLLSITDQVNIPSLVAGRMPQTKTECLGDARAFDESDIGTVVTLSSDNATDTLDMLNTRSFLIVGLANTPLYISTDRGTTTIGDGALKGLLFLHPDAFDLEVYTEVDVCMRRSAAIYSHEYESIMETYKPEITKRVYELAWDQYDNYLDLLGLDRENAKYVDLEEPETYVLTRRENAGFVSFQNDTAIVSAMANLLPVFFIMIALLVCITTMTRMVSEERTQIGVLKAMGFHSWDIAAKYLLYALSATLLGWLLGFFLGTWGLPEVFWRAYGALYKFAPLKYTYSRSLAMVTLGVSLMGILGATLTSCWKSLRSVPAELIRPQRGKSGKRILLEYIPFLWKPLSFLQKITLRNMLRYKLRMTMMLVGIGCCTALMVTAFGVRDSMLHVGDDQFSGVQHYAMAFSFTEGEDTPEEAAKVDGVEDVLPCIQDRVDVYGDTENMHSVTLIGLDSWDTLNEYWTLTWDGQDVSEPGAGEALVSRRLAEKLALSAGDTIEVEDSDLNRVTFRVAGVFENYVGNYLFVQAESCRERFGNEGNNAIMLQASGDLNAIAKALTNLDGVTALSRMDVLLDQVDSAMSCLNYIIWLVVGFAWALAFIVIYNLTNINLAERSREIATVEVLGFYPRETAAYVLRENLVLSFLAAILGLPLGKVMHGVVMGMVMVDNSCFNTHIEWTSYIAAFVCTVLFAWVVGLVMRRHIRKIPMAESLKAVE